jgi:hypothetical protein
VNLVKKKIAIITSSTFNGSVNRAQLYCSLIGNYNNNLFVIHEREDLMC